MTLLVLMSLCAYRIWRAIGLDDIGEGLRGAASDHPRFYGFLTCPWCSGFWVSILVVIVTNQFVDFRLPVLYCGAVATVVGFLGAKLDE